MSELDGIGTNNNTSNIITESTVYNTTTQVDEQDVQRYTTRIEFSTVDIIRFIPNRPIKVLWEEAYFCPCLNPDTGVPKDYCPRCHGKGIAYLPPKETIMRIQSQEKGIYQLDIGSLDVGNAIGTTQLEKRISPKDRFSVREVLMPQQMIYFVSQDRIGKGMPLYYDVKDFTYIATHPDSVRDEDYYIEYNSLFMDAKFENKAVP
ncbi:capsid protein [Staphylococcus phage vB_SauH_DELF3]|nr:capsid protein [Staphylococcus phage vB_SauH_DELF3]